MNRRLYFGGALLYASVTSVLLVLIQSGTGVDAITPALLVVAGTTGMGALHLFSVAVATPTPPAPVSSASADSQAVGASQTWRGTDSLRPDGSLPPEALIESDPLMAVVRTRLAVEDELRALVRFHRGGRSFPGMVHETRLEPQGFLRRPKAVEVARMVPPEPLPEVDESSVRELSDYLASVGMLKPLDLEMLSDFFARADGVIHGKDREISVSQLIGAGQLLHLRLQKEWEPFT